MEPETEKMIAEWPEITEEQAKLLFIRKSAREAFEKGELLEATKGIFKEMVETVIVSDMSKENVAIHIGNLEKARDFLAAFTQGIAQGYASDIEPKIRAKREKEAKEKAAKKAAGGDRRVNELIALAIKASKVSTEETEKRIAKKFECSECKKEVYSLKFHKCGGEGV